MVNFTHSNSVILYVYYIALYGHSIRYHNYVAQCVGLGKILPKLRLHAWELLIKISKITNPKGD